MHTYHIYHNIHIRYGYRLSRPRHPPSRGWAGHQVLPVEARGRLVAQVATRRALQFAL